LEVDGEFDASSSTYRLRCRQSCPPTPGQSEKLPFVIPLRMALLDSEGREMPLKLAGEAHARGNDTELAVTEAEQEFVFEGSAAGRLRSLLRGVSDPVKAA